MSFYSQKKTSSAFKLNFSLKKLVGVTFLLGIFAGMLLALRIYGGERLPQIISLVDPILTQMLNIFIILIIILPISLLLRSIYRRSYMAFKIGIISSIFLLTMILFAFYGLGIPHINIFPFFLNMIEEIFYSIDNILPFLVAIPLLLLFYIKKIRTKAPFTLSNISFRSQFIIIDDGHKRKYKALSILKITNIPRSASIVEQRRHKTAIEKLMIPGEFHYIHYHLTSLAEVLPNFTFEIRILKNSIDLRLIFSNTGTDLNEILEELSNLMNSTIMAFQTAFSGLRFEILRDAELKAAWADIFNIWGSFRFRKIESRKIEIDHGRDRTFLAILRFKDLPNFKMIQKKTQMDALIRGTLGANLDMSYVISAVPVEIYDFEHHNSTPGGFGGTINDPRIKMAKIRHGKTMGMWRASPYAVLRSDDRNKLDVDLNRIVSLFATTFDIRIEILDGDALDRTFRCIAMRTLLDQPMSLTSEQLAILIHLPSEPIPSLSRIDIPEFEIPPENRIQDGLIIGNILLYDQELYPLRLSTEDLRLNVFISGLIGMGKSRLSMNILRQLTCNSPSVHWICLDWKGEYAYLAQEIENHSILLFRPGSPSASLKLNMFDPQQSNSDEHARKLFAIIREVFKSDFNQKSELSTQMESVCKQVIRDVVADPKQRSLNGFIQALKAYAHQHATENRTIIMTVSALLNRFDKFQHGVLKEVLDVTNSNVDFNKLMDTKVVVDLNYILTHGGAKEDVRLLMNIILKYVIDKALARGVTSQLRHLVVIEDAQFLIPQVLREVPETSLIEDIPLLLRGVGEALITIATRPEVSSDIIANSGVKISFKSPYDSQRIAKYQNLNETQESYLRTMPKREAIVTLPNYQFPFRIHTSYFDYQQNPSNVLAEDTISFPVIDDVSTDPEFYNISSKTPFARKNSHSTKKLSQIPSVCQKPSSNQKIEQSRQSVTSNITNFSLVKNILQNGPCDQNFLAKTLNIPKSELDTQLIAYIESGDIQIAITPIFNSSQKQKVYYLPEHQNKLTAAIHDRLRSDFLESGKIGQLEPENPFDYIWYGNNTFLKILFTGSDLLDISEISQILLQWFETAVERGCFELIVIVPYLEWSAQIRTWLKSFAHNQIHIFAYNIDDWQALHDFMERGMPVEGWCQAIQKNLKPTVSPPPSKDNFQIETNIPNCQNTLENNNSPNILQNCESKPSHVPPSNKLKKKAQHERWTAEILERYTDKFPLELLNRFSGAYPSENEVAQFLGTTVNSVEFALRPIIRYLKTVIVRDLADPATYRSKYYGWKNEYLGPAIMQRELLKLFDDKEIAVKTLPFMNRELLMVGSDLVIYTLFDENDFEVFLEIITQNEVFLTKGNFMLIAHTIELQDWLERQVKRLPIKNRIRVVGYDLADLGPTVRQLKDIAPLALA